MWCVWTKQKSPINLPVSRVLKGGEREKSATKGNAAKDEVKEVQTPVLNYRSSMKARLGLGCCRPPEISKEGPLNLTDPICTHYKDFMQRERERERTLLWCHWQYYLRFVTVAPWLWSTDSVSLIPLHECSACPCPLIGISWGREKEKCTRVCTSTHRHVSWHTHTHSHTGTLATQ